MKILSALLSIHILLLVAAPLLKWSSLMTEERQCGNFSSGSGDEKKNKEAGNCCNKEKQKQDTAGNCCNMACNPFMICCNMHALTSQKTAIAAPFIYSTQKYYAISERVYSHFLSDAWKPPRIV